MHIDLRIGKRRLFRFKEENLILFDLYVHTMDFNSQEIDKMVKQDILEVT